MTTRLSVIPLVFASTFLCYGQSGSTPASVLSKFAGTWTMNEARSTLGAALPLRFRTGAGGGLEEVRGSDAAPVVEPVHFDGKPYDIDGGTGTIVWKQTGPDKFERQSSAKGQLVATRRISISNGGKTLTEETERKRADGKTMSLTMVYSRSSGEGSGLAGTWKAMSRHSSIPPQTTYSVAGADSLKFANSLGTTYTFALDNKPVPVVGAGTISGTTIAFRQVDDHTLASTSSRNSVVTATSTVVISQGGKVMTITGVEVGPSASKVPSVVVYEKQ